MTDKQLGKDFSILDLYIQYHSTYIEKYGDKTVVFCQVGDFFEIYAVINDTEEIGPNIYRIADILGIQVTRRNKSNMDVNRGNYLMSGFPLTAIQKHIQTMVSNSYTVVIVRQTTPPPNVRREVSEIISSSMTLMPASSEANHIFVLMFHCENGRWNCGVAMADISTGGSIICQLTSTLEDPMLVFDEITRLLHAYTAKEIVLMGQKLSQEMKETVVLSLGLQQRVAGIHHIWDNYLPSYNRRDYQEAILAKAGIGRGMLSTHVIAGMDDVPMVAIAISYLVQFAYEHNPKLIERLQPPRRISQEAYLVLQYNSAVQLNVIGSGTNNESPLLGLLNRTLTPIGSRLYRERLLNPIVDIQQLQERYTEIGTYIKDNLYQKIRKHLTGVLDLERIIRRMVAETYHPCDWSSFHASLLSCRYVAELLGKNSLSKNIYDVIGSYNEIIRMDEASKYSLGDIRGNIFSQGICSELDELSTIINDHINSLIVIVKKLSDLGGDATICKLDCNDRDGYFLSTTKKRWDAICSHMQSDEASKYKVRPISPISNTLRITSQKIENSSDKIIQSQVRISAIAQQEYLSFVKFFIENNCSIIRSIALEIATIDVQSTNAMNAHEYNYVCPEVHSLQEGASFIKAEQLRHPIIERIQKRTDYVANDICLDPSKPGLLLYGVNSSGKSSLMKAIGLSIIMAQSGMYVPCRLMKFAPYMNLFTRISGNDNIYQGLSSFAVEMTELKNIVLRADKRSLVLGDELCAGTESVSAISIVASGIDMLLKKKSVFVFATHLHELIRIPDVDNYIRLDVLHVAHMHTEAQNGRIIYDRMLRPGSGSDVYGIEVCRGLGMPEDFMRFAERVRRIVKGDSHSFVPDRQSRYNARVLIGMCAVCRSAPACDTHHIRYQQNADKNGFIEGTHVHKNMVSNLVPLCSRCHLSEHNGSLRINGWIQTSDGIELDFTECLDESSVPYNEKEEDRGKPDIEELVAIWRPYLRYTRKGWMLRKSVNSRAKFREISEDKLLEVLKKIPSIPSCLIPASTVDIEIMQTMLLDVTM